MAAPDQVDDFKLEVGSRWPGHDKHELLRIQLIRRGIDQGFPTAEFSRLAVHGFPEVLDFGCNYNSLASKPGRCSYRILVAKPDTDRFLWSRISSICLQHDHAHDLAASVLRDEAAFDEEDLLSRIDRVQCETVGHGKDPKDGRLKEIRNALDNHLISPEGMEEDFLNAMMEEQDFMRRMIALIPDEDLRTELEEDSARLAIDRAPYLLGHRATNDSPGRVSKSQKRLRISTPPPVAGPSTSPGQKRPTHPQASNASKASYTEADFSASRGSRRLESTRRDSGCLTASARTRAPTGCRLAILQQLPRTPTPSESGVKQISQPSTGFIDLCNSEDDCVDVKPDIQRRSTSASCPPVAGPSRAQNAQFARVDPFAHFLDSLGESSGFAFSDYRDKFTSPNINVSSAAQLLSLAKVTPVPGQPSPLDTLLKGLEAAGMPPVWQAVFRHALIERARQ